jgi:hypothetical protein
MDKREHACFAQTMKKGSRVAAGRSLEVTWRLRVDARQLDPQPRARGAAEVARPEQVSAKSADRVEDREPPEV